jgi:hypothetical protein
MMIFVNRHGRQWRVIYKGKMYKGDTAVDYVTTDKTCLQHKLAR